MTASSQADDIASNADLERGDQQLLLYDDQRFDVFELYPFYPHDPGSPPHSLSPGFESVATNATAGTETDSPPAGDLAVPAPVPSPPALAPATAPAPASAPVPASAPPPAPAQLSPAQTPSPPEVPGHLDEKEAVIESLVGYSEVLGFGAGPCTPLLQIQTDTSVNTPLPQANPFDTPNDGQQHVGSPEEGVVLQPEPVSPLPRSGSRGGLWRRISRRSNSVSSAGVATLQADPSLRSQLSVRSNLSSRWSFRRSIRRASRARDLEEGDTDDDDLPHDHHAELEGGARQIGPFELYSLTREERRAVLSKPPPPKPLPARGPAVAAHRAIVETLFGRKLCSPHYLDLRRVYMAQVDRKLTAALGRSEVANPNPAVWPKPFAYLVGFLGLVSQRLTPLASVASFVLDHRAEFESMIRHGTVPPTAPPHVTNPTDADADADADAEPVGGSATKPGGLSPWHQKILYEWMRFSLEAWMMVDLQLEPSSSIRRLDSDSVTTATAAAAEGADLVALPQFYEPPIEQLVRQLLPPPPRAPYSPYSLPSDASIQRHEVSASILHEWKAFSFKWTQDIAEHLRLDSQEKVVWIYANVAFCHLHAVAKENSALHKAGFKPYHSVLVEVSETYRVIFGGDHRSQAHFLELEAHNPTDGFFNIFALPGIDWEPRFHYNVASDFPVFGERMLVLRKLCCSPRGIRDLWRDRRDSLQWYTFWAVVMLGCFGALVGFLQLALSAVQTWATVASLHGK